MSFCSNQQVQTQTLRLFITPFEVQLVPMCQVLCSRCYVPGQSCPHAKKKKLCSLIELFNKKLKSKQAVKPNLCVSELAQSVCRCGAGTLVGTTQGYAGELIRIRAPSKTMDMYPIIHNIINLLLMMPVSTASADRCFICLTRVKTYLRNSMTETLALITGLA